MAARPTRTFAALALAVSAMATPGCTNTPTLPLPPPLVEIETPPGPQGRVTVHVDGVRPGATVFAFNERRERGVIGVATEQGTAELQIAAQEGDVLRVWQRVGGEAGQFQRIMVPLGGDAAVPRLDGATAPDGG